jgi:putative sigma-54 modulation protein
MNIKIQADGFVADSKLNQFIETKLSKLSTFYDKLIDVNVKLSLDSHSKVKDKVVHILCHIPHNNLFVESTAKAFEEATDNCIEDLKRQIKKKKELAMEKGKGVRSLDEYLVEVEEA